MIVSTMGGGRNILYIFPTYMLPQGYVLKLFKLLKKIIPYLILFYQVIREYTKCINLLMISRSGNVWQPNVKTIKRRKAIPYRSIKTIHTLMFQGIHTFSYHFVTSFEIYFVLEMKTCYVMIKLFKLFCAKVCKGFHLCHVIFKQQEHRNLSIVCLSCRKGCLKCDIRKADVFAT